MAKRNNRRQYDDEFRASAVLMLQAQGYPEKLGALSAVASHLKVSERTLRRWFKGQSNPVPDNVVRRKKGELVQLLEDEARAILYDVDEARKEADYKSLITGLAILIDKMQLLSGEPTAHTKVSGDVEVVVDNARDKLAHILNQYATRTSQDGVVELVN